MKSAEINRYGGSEIVEINQNTPELTLSSGKVLVSIKAAGLNPADWKIREGYFQQMIPLQFPFTLGMDFSGIVKEIGEGVSDFKQGDEVYGQAGVVTGGSGAFAEMALAKTESIANKPKRLSHVEAAAEGNQAAQTKPKGSGRPSNCFRSTTVRSELITDEEELREIIAVTRSGP
ncbi:MAG: alcohol dehydrogenase catalytic domain-containing protein [Nitrososphaeraceae archaeon]